MRKLFSIVLALFALVFACLSVGGLVLLVEKLLLFVAVCVSITLIGRLMRVWKKDEKPV